MTDRGPGPSPAGGTQDPPAPRPATDDAAIRAVVVRLSRPHPSGGAVIERAAILAEGEIATAVVDWITHRAGEGEHAVRAASGGLHGRRGATGGSAGPPLRYILPAGALD